MLTFGVVPSGALRPHPVRSDLKKRDHTRTQKPQNQRSQIQIRHGLSRWSPTMTSFLKGQNRPITVCHGSSRPGMLGSWDFMVLSSDNDTGIVYTFQVPQSVIRQRLQITRSIETYAYPEIISICDLCVVMDRQGNKPGRPNMASSMSSSSTQPCCPRHSCTVEWDPMGRTNSSVVTSSALGQRRVSGFSTPPPCVVRMRGRNNTARKHTWDVCQES